MIDSNSNDAMTLAGDAAERIVAAFDPNTGQWNLKAVGDFWDAIRMAMHHGLNASGVRIAILDTCPDLSIPQLAQQVTLHNLGNDTPHAHGTAVALMIGSIASQAELVHYAISENSVPRRSLFAKAMTLLESDPVDYVCLSLGDVQPIADPDISWIEPYVRSGDIATMIEQMASKPLPVPLVKTCHLNPCTCDAVERVAATGAIILAAAGNSDGARFCPARTGGSVSVGFQRVDSRYENGSQLKSWAAPEGEQGSWVNYTMIQPTGVIGSSFAAPSLTAALALRQQKTPIVDLLRVNELRTCAKFIETLLERHSDDSEILANLTAQYEHVCDLIFLPLPHITGNEMTPSLALEAGIFLANPAVNMGLVLLKLGRLGRALQMFDWAREVAPWLAPAHANWARVLLTDAQYRAETGHGELTSVRPNLAAARESYRRALEIEPEALAYQEGLDEVEALEKQLADRPPFSEY